MFDESDDEPHDVAVDLRSPNRASSSPLRPIFSPDPTERTLQWDSRCEPLTPPGPGKDVCLPPAPLPAVYGRRALTDSGSSIFARVKEPTGSPWDFRPRNRSLTRRKQQTGNGKFLMGLFMCLTSGILFSAILLIRQEAAIRNFESSNRPMALPERPSCSAVSSCQGWKNEFTLEDSVQKYDFGNSEVGHRLPWGDRTGAGELEIAFDYALASLGARVLTTRETKPISMAEAKFLGVTLFEMDTMESLKDAPLLPIIIPGRCWRFRDFPGTLVIQLAERINVTSFSLSHVTGVGIPLNRLRSAPHEFEVWGLTSAVDNDPARHLLGNYSYVLSYGQPTQIFPVQNPSPLRLNMVELRILSNHGLRDWTCVYRFKVFGIAEEDQIDH